ncbi:der [Symbiodinium natans]|uniref:Der protein n=1 Tax=Symbiodinium natans TaxID=878477 RepID=A0A812LXT7_9DINO|nr:der [Symbiodinium natans]
MKQGRVPKPHASERLANRTSLTSSSESTSPQPQDKPPTIPHADAKLRRSDSHVAKEVAADVMAGASMLLVARVLAKASELLPENEQLKTLGDKTRLVVTIAGEHSTGKSTIINAILGEKKCQTSNTQGTTEKVNEFPGETAVVVDTPGLDAPDFQEHEEQALNAIRRSDFVFLTVLANKPTSTAADTLLKQVQSSKARLVVVVTYWDALKTEASRKECKEQVRKFVESRGFPDAKIFYTDAAAAEQARCQKEACRDAGFNGVQALLDQELSDKSYLCRSLLEAAAEPVQEEILKVKREIGDLERKASKSSGWSWGLGISSGVSGVGGLALLAAEAAVAGPIGLGVAAGLGIGAIVSAGGRGEVNTQSEMKGLRVAKLQELGTELKGLLDSLTCTVAA